MEPPPLSAATATVAAPTPAPTLQPYPDSIDSSPRSCHTNSFDDPPLSNASAAATSAKLRLMCSYGGHIVPRPHDKSLCYVGGDTRIIVVERHVTLASLTARLSHSLLNGKPFVLKYQLPSEDLDSLISVTTDEDLENMIEEYERTSSNFQKPCRLRLFLFQPKLEASQSIIESTTKSDDWFLNALNGSALSNRGFSDSASVNCLLGLDDDLVTAVAAGAGGAAAAGGGGGSNEGVVGLQKKVQDVQSVPDSPMMETTSSFGSSSSSPSLVNLPPIRVHVEENCGGGGVKFQDQKPVVGVEDQFSQMNVGGGGGGGGLPKQQQQQEEGFVVLSSPAAAATVGVAGMVVPGEYVNRVFSDDERSDHGVPVGYRKAPPQPPPQSQSQQPPQPQTIAIQSSQQKSSGGGGSGDGVLELPSPDSVSSDSSLTNAINRQKPVMYQDQVMQIQSGPNRVPGVNPIDPKINVSDPNAPRVHLQQQVQDPGSGYVLQSQIEQQQQQQPQQQLQQPQQFIHAGAHYIHHHPAGGVPISAYYPVYLSQQQQQQQHHHQQHQHHQIDQQYPVYYMQPARQPQAYNMSVQQQPTMSEAPTAIPSSRPQTPPSPAMVPPPTAYNPMRNTHIAKPEMAAAGVYRTTTAGAPQLVQVPSSQHQHQHQQQYVGYSQNYHPSQSVAPTSAATANYGYEFADPSHAQIYYTQPLAPTMPSHYQTMTGTAAVVLPEGSGQLPTDNMKQQIRTSQPL